MMKKIISILIILSTLCLFTFSKSPLKVSASDISNIPNSAINHEDNYGKVDYYSNGVIFVDLFNQDKSINYAKKGSIIYFNNALDLSLSFASCYHYYEENNYSLKITVKNVLLTVSKTVSGTTTTEEVTDSYSALDLGKRIESNTLNSSFPSFMLSINGAQTEEKCGLIEIEISCEYSDYSSSSTKVSLPINYVETDKVEEDNCIFLTGYVGSGTTANIHEDNLVLINKDLINVIKDSYFIYSQNFNFSAETQSSDENIIMINNLKEDTSAELVPGGTGECIITKNIYLNFTIDGVAYKTFYKKINYKIYVYQTSDITLKANGKDFTSAISENIPLNITIETSIPTEYLDYFQYQLVEVIGDQTTNIISEAALTDKNLTTIEQTIGEIKKYQLYLFDGIYKEMYGGYYENYKIIQKEFTLTYNDLLTKPETIETSDNKYSFDYEEKNNTFYIDIYNYQALNNYYQLSIIYNGSNEISIENSMVKIICQSDERAVFTIVAIDEEVTITKTIEVNIAKKKTQYSFNVDNIVLYCDSQNSQTVEIGLLKNGSFSSLDFVDINFNFYSKYNNVILERGETGHSLIITAKVNNGVDTVYAIINDESIISVDVIIKESINPVTNNLAFVEGDVISILLESTGNEITIDTDINAAFEFVSLDKSVAVVEVTGLKKAIINGIKKGKTTIFAFNNSSDDESYIAQIDVIVLEEKPKLNIAYENAVSNGPVNALEKILVRADAGGFKFSDNTTYIWYLDGELLDLSKVEKNDETSFLISLASGEHELKLDISDAKQDITASCVQKINVLSEQGAQHQLSLPYEGPLYLDVKGLDFEINALLDNVVNPSFEYKWSLSNEIVNIKIDGNEKILIKPESVGVTTLTVMCNVGKALDNYLFAKLEIIVLDVSQVSVKELGALSPNKEGKLQFYGDDKKVPNLDLKLTVLFNGKQTTDYTYSEGIITFSKLNKGKYTVSTTYNYTNQSSDFRVSNINIRQFAKTILPYLFIILFFIILIAYCTKKQKPLLDKVASKFNQYQTKLLSIPNQYKAGKEAKYLNKSLRQTQKIKKQVDYLIDLDIDEFMIIKTELEKIIVIITAAKKVKISSNQFNKILNYINSKEIPNIINQFAKIKEERKSFDEFQAAKDYDNNNDEKASPITKDQYLQLLAQNGFTDEDDND